MEKRFEKLNEIYTGVRLDVFVMSVSYILDIGMKRLVQLSDEEINIVGDKPWATKEYLQLLMRTGRKIAFACENNPVSLIQFCMMNEVFENPAKNEDLLWDTLKSHFGHKVEIAVYGDPDEPESVTLEDLDNGEIILDAEMYTLCGK